MDTLTNKRQQHGLHKQTLTNKRQRRSDSPTAAPGPRWLILNSCIDDEDGASVADAETTAASCTSLGKPFSISFGIAPPPACCSLHYDGLGGITPGDGDGKHSNSGLEDVRIIAGNDDALLIKITVPSGLNPPTTFYDYFLYEAGGGTRPPSLSLLPGFNVPLQKAYRNHHDPTPKFRSLDMENTGILRRGEDDVLVCQYEMTWDPPIYDMAELCMLHIGRDREWIVRRVPIVEHREGISELQPWHRRQSLIANNSVVPVGNRFLCWVHNCNGFMVCDMADEDAPKVRNVPLPAPARQHDGYCGHYPDEAWAHYTLGAAGPDAVRFVSVSPPRCWQWCCYYGPGKTSCEGSSASFSVTTWTMTLSTEEATTWVKDVVLDCDEICKWRLPNYGCLPRDKHLEYPMVRCDDPDVIYFRVEFAMAVAINTRSKKLLSVIPSGTRDLEEDEKPSRLITAKLGW